MFNLIIRFCGPLAFAGCLFLGAVDAAHTKALTAKAQRYEMVGGGLLGNVSQCDK